MEQQHPSYKAAEMREKAGKGILEASVVWEHIDNNGTIEGVSMSCNSSLYNFFNLSVPFIVAGSGISKPISIMSFQLSDGTHSTRPLTMKIAFDKEKNGYYAGIRQKGNEVFEASFAVPIDVIGILEPGCVSSRE